MSDVRITAGTFHFSARFEHEAAPRTCAAFERLLPFTSQVIHVRWSGEAVWVPLGDLSLGLEAENATCYPHPGEILLYPGGLSETELLIGYGRTSFASKAGALAGNHFLTMVSGLEQLPALGRLVLWQGAQPLVIEVGGQVLP
ncbi:MAG: DUF3830 family protein [Vicinamibacterales bacterium]